MEIVMSKLLRIKCPTCGHVADIPDTGVPCPKCGKALNLSPDSVVQIYRMGSPIGVAVGYGIYINGQPYGHLANKQTIRIPLPYGVYNFHFTCGLTRNCEDLVVTLSPNKRHVFMKAHIHMGFWTNTIRADEVDVSEMPPLD